MPSNDVVHYSLGRARLIYAECEELRAGSTADYGFQARVVVYNIMTNACLATRIEIRRKFHGDQHSHQRTPSLATYQHTIPRSVVTLMFFIHYYIMLLLSVLYFIYIPMLYLYTYIIRQELSILQGIYR